MRARLRRRALGAPAAALVYLIAFAACFPAVTAHPTSRVTAGGDGVETLRDYWAASEQHRNPFDFSHDAYNGAPQGVSQSPAVVLAQTAIQTAFVWELRGPLGLTGAWNAFMLIGFLGSALAMYALLRWLGCTRAASLLGGYVFAFSPYPLERAYAGHLALLQNWIFVLLAFALLRLGERRSPRAALLAGCTLALAFYLSAYQGLLAGIATFVFALVELVRLRGGGAWRRTVALTLLCYGAALVAMAPIFIGYAREHGAVQAQAAVCACDRYVYSASLSAYLVPSPRNPLFHWLRGLHPSDLTEETLFIGYAVSALALAAIVLALRHERWLGRDPLRRRGLAFFGVLAPVAFLFSLPPSYRVAGVTIDMPSATLGHLSNLWRVYARFGELAGFAVIALAALALSALARRPGRRWRALTPLVMLVAVLEILPGQVSTLPTSARAQPAWVLWLARQPRGIVASYPWAESDALGLDEWYEVFDHDPEFERSIPEVLVPDREMGIRELTEAPTPATAGVLAAEDVRYVIVHDDDYASAGEPSPRLDPRDYRLLARFPGVRIYAVHATPANVDQALRADAAALMLLQGIGPPAVTYGSGFNTAEQYEGMTSRWMIQDGQLTLVNHAPAMDVTVSAKAFANQGTRELELLDGAGRVLGRQTVPDYQVPISFGPFALPHGDTTLTLVASPGPERLGPTDARLASVFIEPITTTPRLPYLGR